MAVRLEKQDAIGHIVLDRPPANSYDRAFMDELDAAIEDARKDDGVKAIVVRSASEKFFSAGADVSVFAKSDFDTQNAFVVCANEAMSKFESTPKVVIAKQFDPPTPMITLQGPSVGSGIYRAEFLALPEWCTP